MLNMRLPFSKKRIALGILFIISGLFLFIVLNPIKPLRFFTSFSPIPISIEKIRWTSLSSWQLDKIKIGDFSQVQSLDLDWSWWDLLIHKQIKSIQIHRPQISLARLEKSQSSFKNSPDPRSTSSSWNWTFQKIEIFRGNLFLDNLFPQAKINIPLGGSKPLILENLQTNPSFGDTPLLRLKSQDFTLYSPVDATTPVLEFVRIEIDATLQELTQNILRRLHLYSPTIHLGPDLFWFTEQFQKNQSSSSSLPWTIRELEIQHVQMHINGLGQPGITLPITFSKNISEVRTDQLDKIFRQNEFKVTPGTLFFPRYGLNILDYSGQIQFGLPVTEANIQNQVIVLEAKAIEWKKLKVTDPWVSFTFDSRGIFGKIGGKAYGSNLFGECSIFFKAGFPWNASFHGTGFRVEEPLKILAEDHFRMTGIMNLNLQVNARSTVFEKSSGKIWLTGGGQMIIPAIDDVLQKLPKSWSPLKKQMATIGLEAFKTFDYTSGTFDLLYNDPKSHLTLDLQGKQGRRRFQIDWTQEK